MKVRYMNKKTENRIITNKKRYILKGKKRKIKIKEKKREALSQSYSSISDLKYYSALAGQRFLYEDQQGWLQSWRFFISSPEQRK